MAKNFEPLRITRPTAAPVSTYFDVSPLAQLATLEASQGMQVARALSGLSPVLMSLSATMGNKEFREGAEAAVEMPKGITDMTAANKWFDEQNLPGPLRQIAFRESLGRLVKGQQLSSALEANRDRLTRLTDDNGNPITQAARDKMLQEIINGVDVGSDPYVRRGFNSVQSQIIARYQTENDRILAARLREKNDDAISSELYSKIIGLISDPDVTVDQIREFQFRATDELRRSGMDPSGQRQFYMGLAKYAGSLLSDPNTSDGELGRLQALISEVVNPEEYGRPPLSPEVVVEYETLLNQIESRLDDPSRTAERLAERYRGPIFQALSKRAGQPINQSEYIDFVAEVTGLTPSEAADVAVRLTSLFDNYNSRLASGPISADRFDELMQAVSQGEFGELSDVPAELLVQLSQDQLGELTESLNLSPRRYPEVGTYIEDRLISSVSEIANRGVNFGLEPPERQAAAGQYREVFNGHVERLFDGLRNNPDYVNGNSNTRKTMAREAVSQASDTAISEVLQGDSFQDMRRAAMTRSVRRAEDVLVGFASGMIENVMADEVGDPEDRALRQLDLDSSAFATAQDMVREFLASEGPETTPKDLADWLGNRTTALEYQNRFINALTGVQPLPGSEAPPPPAIGNDSVSFESTDWAIGGQRGNAGDGWFFFNSDLYDSFSKYRSVIGIYKEAEKSGSLTDRHDESLVAARDEFLNRTAEFQDSIIELGGVRQLPADLDPRFNTQYPAGTLRFTVDGVEMSQGFGPPERFRPRRVVWELDRKSTLDYLAGKGILTEDRGGWSESELVPRDTDDNGNEYYETAEGVRFYGVHSKRDTSVDPRVHLFFRNEAELNTAYNEFLTSKSGKFALVMGLGRGVSGITPEVVFRSQRSLIPLRRSGNDAFVGPRRRATATIGGMTVQNLGD